MNNNKTKDYLIMSAESSLTASEINRVVDTLHKIYPPKQTHVDSESKSSKVIEHHSKYHADPQTEINNMQTTDRQLSQKSKPDIQLSEAEAQNVVTQDNDNQNNTQSGHRKSVQKPISSIQLSKETEIQVDNNNNNKTLTAGDNNETNETTNLNKTQVQKSQTKRSQSQKSQKRRQRKQKKQEQQQQYEQDQQNLQIQLQRIEDNQMRIVHALKSKCSAIIRVSQQIPNNRWPPEMGIGQLESLACTWYDGYNVFCTESDATNKDFTDENLRKTEVENATYPESKSSSSERRDKDERHKSQDKYYSSSSSSSSSSKKSKHKDRDDEEDEEKESSDDSDHDPDSKTFVNKRAWP